MREQRDVIPELVDNLRINRARAGRWAERLIEAEARRRPLSLADRTFYFSLVAQNPTNGIDLLRTYLAVDRDRTWSPS